MSRLSDFGVDELLSGLAYQAIGGIITVDAFRQLARSSFRLPCRIIIKQEFVLMQAAESTQGT